MRCHPGDCKGLESPLVATGWGIAGGCWQKRHYVGVMRDR
ncbi:hypothetical protein [Azospirillum melinis]